MRTELAALLQQAEAQGFSRQAVEDFAEILAEQDRRERQIRAERQRRQAKARTMNVPPPYMRR